MGKFEDTLKKGAWTAAEVAVVTGGAIIATHFTPATKIFEKQVTADPTYIQQPLYKYWGGIKALAACGISTMVDNPWLKMGLIGVAVQGTIEQAMVLSDKVQMIGAGDNKSLNEKLKQLAETHRNSMMGNTTQSAVAGTTQSAVAGVAGWGMEPSGGVAGGYSW